MNQLMNSGSENKDVLNFDDNNSDNLFFQKKRIKSVDFNNCT